MEKGKIDISLIYVNHNSSHLLNNSIRSFLKYAEGFSYEIIVVDNSISDKERFELTNLSKIYDLRLLFSDSNEGFGSANNMACLPAKGEYLFFVNCDTIFISNSCQIMLSFLKTNKSCGIAGATLLTNDLKPNFSYSLNEINLRNTKKNDSIFRLFNRKKTLNELKPIQISGFVSGAALMISKTLFANLGMFPKSIFMYGEDVYLCYQCIKKAHLNVYSLPDAKIIHLEGGTFQLMSKRRFSIACDGNFEYFNLLFGREQALLFLKHKKYVYMRNSVLSFVCFKYKNAKKFKLMSTVYKEKLLIERQKV